MSRTKAFPSMQVLFKTVSGSPCLGCLVFLVCALPLQAAPYSFQGLGDLPGGIPFSQAWGVSSDGTAVVGKSHTASGDEAFRWTSDDGMIGLGALPGVVPNRGVFYSWATGASVDGTTVVGYSRSLTSPTYEAFRWTSSGGLVGLGDLPGENTESIAAAISADGTVVVGYGYSAFGREAYRWTSDTGMVGLGDLSGGTFDSYAGQTSADGNVVVGYATSASGREAFRWTIDNGMVGLGDLPGGEFQSGASDVSADGTVVVGGGNSNLGLEAFRWTSSTGIVGLGDLPGGSFYSNARAVSDDGAVIVGISNSSNATEAFIWTTDSGMVALRDFLIASGASGVSEWRRLDFATGISADGRTIVGWGTNQSGQTEAWIATIPEPSSLVMAACAVLSLVALACRRGRSAR